MNGKREYGDYQTPEYFSVAVCEYLNISADICNVYAFDKPNEVKNSFGYVDGKLYSNTTKWVDDFSGNCCFEWRQGVKHDCSKVMELSLEGTAFINGLKEYVDIEKNMYFRL